jgi:hypothetical protein
MYQRRRSVGNPAATGRFVDGSRLDDKIGALKSRVGSILRRFDRRIVQCDDSGSPAAGEGASAEEGHNSGGGGGKEGRRRRRHRGSARLTREIQGVRNEVAEIAERSDRMTETLRRIRREMIANRRRTVMELGGSSGSTRIGGGARASLSSNTRHRRQQEQQGQQQQQQQQQQRRVPSDHLDLTATVVTATAQHRADVRRGPLRDWLSDVLNDDDNGVSSSSARGRGLSAADVATLGSRRVAKKLENPCCICLESIATGNMVTRLPCCHAFHTVCIGRWLGQVASCPLCVSVVGVN